MTESVGRNEDDQKPQRLVRLQVPSKQIRWANPGRLALRRDVRRVAARTAPSCLCDSPPNLFCSKIVQCEDSIEEMQSKLGLFYQKMSADFSILISDLQRLRKPRSEIIINTDVDRHSVSSLLRGSLLWDEKDDNSAGSMNEIDLSPAMLKVSDILTVSDSHVLNMTDDFEPDNLFHQNLPFSPLGQSPCIYRFNNSESSNLDGHMNVCPIDAFGECPDLSPILSATTESILPVHASPIRLDTASKTSPKRMIRTRRYKARTPFNSPCPKMAFLGEDLPSQDCPNKENIQPPFV